jgi:hypothetical protein
MRSYNLAVVVLYFIFLELLGLEPPCPLLLDLLVGLSLDLLFSSFEEGGDITGGTGDVTCLDLFALLLETWP